MCALLLVSCKEEAVETTPKPIHTHAFGEWQTVNGSTCTAEGEAERLCECGERETKKLDKLEHEYSETVVAPTCTEDGYTLYECACGDSYNDNKTEKTGHDHGEWAVVTTPTCQTKGEEKRECKNCGEKEARELETVGHSFGEWTEIIKPTCETKGAETRTCVYGCGEIEIREIGSLGGHSLGEWYVYTAASCTTNGEERRECKNAGCSHYETKDIVGSHEIGDWQTVKAPTCEEAGEEKRECKNCEYSESREIAALGAHEIGDWYVATAPTCLTDGIEKRECTRDGCEFSEERALVGGHDMSDWQTVSGWSCTESGEIARYCSQCDYSESEIIEADGHSYGEWVKGSDKIDRRSCLSCSDMQKRPSVFSVSTASVTSAARMERFSATVNRKQGGCYNGSRFYQAFVSKDESQTSIGMIDLKTGKVIYSEPRNLGHANDITYNETTNCIYVISGSTLYTFDADTLEYKGTMRLSTSASAISYNAHDDTYVAYSSKALLFFDSEGDLMSSVSVSESGVTSQGVCSDENYVYMLFCTSLGSSKYSCQVYVYDYSGNCQSKITVSIPGNHEPENISVVDGALYIGNCTGESYVLLYKVDPAN